MINALRTAATGMEAQQTRINSISNDLANVNTPGYKKSRAAFEDLYYDQVKLPGALNDAAEETPNGIQIGHGTRLTSVSKIFTNGTTNNTGNSLDLAIEGQGFFVMVDSNGDEVYTRNGTFQANKDGEVVNQAGLVLEPSITLPTNIVSLNVAADGTVSAVTSDNEVAQELGSIEVAMFANPAGLQYVGGNLYKASGASGEVVKVAPGEDGSGKVAQGFLENSNVDIGESLITMIVAQRSYEANSKVIEAADRMMQQANNLL